MRPEPSHAFMLQVRVSFEEAQALAKLIRSIPSVQVSTVDEAAALCGALVSIAEALKRFGFTGR